MIENHIIIMLMKNICDYRIVYMGTPEMSAQILERMIKEGFNIVAVIAQEDKPVGRKGLLEPVPTKHIAMQYNIPVYQPHRIRKEYEFVRDLQPDLLLTMAYGQIVPHELLVMPKFGALNLHGSILPSYRGAAPIQRAIMNGEKESGVTLMEMVDEMDAGKMFATSKFAINDDENYTHICEKIVDASIDLVLNALPKYFKGELCGEEQDSDAVTFADKILPENEKLNLDFKCYTFIRYVNALSYEPGAYLLLNDQKFKILKAHQVSNEIKEEIGTLTVEKRVFLQLSDGVIELDEVQLQGKKKMDGKSFANGNKIFNNLKLK